MEEEYVGYCYGFDDDGGGDQGDDVHDFDDSDDDSDEKCKSLPRSISCHSAKSFVYSPLQWPQVVENSIVVNISASVHCTLCLSVQYVQCTVSFSAV